MNDIEPCDFGMFRELYDTLAAFAFAYENEFGEMHGMFSGSTLVLSNRLRDRSRVILSIYPEASASEVLKLVAEIDSVFAQYGLGGEEHDEWFFSNRGFMQHPDWQVIRDSIRAFLLRRDDSSLSADFDAGPSDIAEEHYWWFQHTYALLGRLADLPENTIARVGGGRISIPEDQGIELGQFRQCIHSWYSDATDMAVVSVVDCVHTILARCSRNGETFDGSFWTNGGYREHSDWDEIRRLVRAFLVC